MYYKTVARWLLSVLCLHTCGAAGRHVFALVLRRGAFTRSLGGCGDPAEPRWGWGLLLRPSLDKAAGKVRTAFSIVTLIVKLARLSFFGGVTDESFENCRGYFFV